MLGFKFFSKSLLEQMIGTACQRRHFVFLEMSTLTSCTNHLLKEGFTEKFKPKHEGIEAPSTGKVYIPAEVKIVSFYRFEGESDPADNSILYAVEANDGTK